MELFNDKTERLIITHIVNENFKSFAGVQKLGPFHKSFTSIVGPNGSGKSNVIDSILFVFGYRSNKIRSKKLSNLIHKSENYNDYQKCTVSIHFAKIDESMDDKMTETFVISRTARIDNSSDYYLNHTQKITFSEIQKMLISYDIDVDHNRFLILQGEVEQISQMKPKGGVNEDGILEYLEDIIGTNKYIEPINKVKQSMEELNDLRAEKYNRVKITEKEKCNLEPARKDALNYLEKEKERNKTKSIILLNKMNQIKVDDGELLQKKENLEILLSKIMESRDESECELRKINENIENITKELSPLSNNVDKLRQKIVKMEKEQTKRLQEEKYTTEKMEQLNEEFQKNCEKISEIENVSYIIKESLEKMNESKEKLNEDLKELEESYNTLMVEVKKSTKDLTKEKSELDEIILEKTEKVNEIKNEIDEIKSQIELLKSDEKNVTSQIKQCELQIKNFQNFLDLNENSNKLKEIENEKEELTKLKENFENIKKEEASLLETYKEKHSLFEHVKLQNNNFKFKNKIVGSLLKAQSKGELEGIYGRMGDLAYISSKYDCAVSTAFPSLDNILVENIDVAKNCVEFLRCNNLGTSTFICLDKMKTWKKRIEETKIDFKTPNNAPRLFDLIELTDEKFENAFYFIMRDTLVAQNMEEATLIAFKSKQRWRVVTVGGELVEKSGTMSGGGTRKLTGRMLTLSDKQNNSVLNSKNPRRLSDLDMHKLEIELTNLKLQITEIKNEKSQIKSKLDNFSKSIPEKETNLQKVYMEIDSSKNEIVVLKDQIEHLKKDLENVKPDEKKINELKGVINQKNQGLEKVSVSLEKIKTKVENVNEQITNISNKILQQVQFKISSVSRLLDEVSTEISKKNAVLSNHKKQEDKFSKLNMELEKELLKLETIKNNKDENDQTINDENLSKLKNELINEEERLDEEKNKLTQFNVQISELQNKIESEKMKLVDTRNDLDKISSKCASSNHILNSIEKELEQLDSGLLFENKEEWKKNINDLDELHNNINELEKYLKENKVNLKVIDEYKDKVAIYMERVAELEEITQQYDKFRIESDKLYKDRLNQFMEGFSIINAKLKEFYQLITLGGDAELEFVDSLDPFVEGIVFSVRPPNKSWKVIGNLSGGEKTLSSLAFVFALHHFKPSPFYVMDEIDAALDFKNVSIIANYIKERTKNAQFIIISLRNNMFELANVLVGIYKTNNSTKSISVDPFKMITVE